MSAMHNEGFLNTGDLEIADIIKLSLDPIFVHEMNARYLSFPDKFSETRKDFMKNVFQSYQSYDFYEGSTKFISSAEHHYQVLIIGGNDLPRISDILKKNSPILARKLKICLTKGVSASRRAHILAAGCDDVIDVERINPAEAAARIRRMWNRYQQGNETSDEISRTESRFAQICGTNTLNRTEREVMFHLLKAFDRGATVSAPYYILQHAAGRDFAEVSINHLKVIVSGLRKKLNPNYIIKADSGVGYKLTKIGN